MLKSSSGDCSTCAVLLEIIIYFWGELAGYDRVRLLLYEHRLLEIAWGEVKLEVFTAQGIFHPTSSLCL